MNEKYFYQALISNYKNIILIKFWHLSKAQSYFFRGNVAQLHDRTKKTLQRSSWQKDACEIKNTFTPYVKSGICEAAIPAARRISQANQLDYKNKGNAAAIVVIGGLFGVGAVVGAKLAPVLAVAGGGLISSSAYASSQNL